MKNEQKDIIFCEICLEQFKEEDESIKFTYDSVGEAICKNCAYKIWTRKCVKCLCLFKSPDSSGIFEYCPNCEEEEGKERYGRKATKNDIDKLFNGKI
jgi:hypothetical protein